MKFCPECGSVRGEKDKCECGYDYIKGEVDLEVRNKETNPPRMYADIMEPQTNNRNIGSISLEELKKKKKDLGNLLSVSYTSAGGMMGSYFHQELSFETNEVMAINQDWHHGEKTKKIYKGDSKDVEKIKKILLDNNFAAWSEIPIDNVNIVFDAANSSMSLRFEKETVTISSRIFMSDEERVIYFDVNRKISNLREEKNLISDEVLTEGEHFPLEFAMATTPVSRLRRFCPECGALFEDGVYECNDCGYVVPEGDRN